MILSTRLTDTLSYIYRFYSHPNSLIFLDVTADGINVIFQASFHINKYFFAWYSKSMFSLKTERMSFFISTVDDIFIPTSVF